MEIDYIPKIVTNVSSDRIGSGQAYHRSSRLVLNITSHLPDVSGYSTPDVGNTPMWEI